VVLVEPFEASLAATLETIALEHEPLVPVTVYQADDGSPWRVGDRRVIRSDSSIDLPLPEGIPRETLMEAAARVLETRKTAVMEFTDAPAGYRALIEYLAPPLKLFVFGAGQDTTALLAIAADLGWETTVVDPGSVVEARRRVPGTVRVITAEPAEVVGDLPIDDRTAVVMLSHQFQRDRALLEHLSRTGVPYVGLIGAYARRDALLSALAPGCLEELGARLHAPIGLDIGGETPEEIALSIAAEITAVFNGRSGGFLRDGRDSIHGRSGDEGRSP
jgi:xanthine/CO dehydrogenase XdhC/CoxF family maturation factor